MAYTQAQVDALKKMAAKGVISGRVGDEQVQFASLAELRAQIRTMEAEVSRAGAARAATPTVSYPLTTRGL